jgi:hypothetical protein
LLPSCPGWSPRRRLPGGASSRASSGRASSPWSAKPGRLSWRRSPVGVHHVVSTQRFGCPGPAVQPSSVWPSGVQRVQPVRCPAVWCLPVQRPAGCCPPRPSGRVHLVPPQAVALGTRSRRRATCTTGTSRGPGGCHVVERLGRRPSRPTGRRRCRGHALVSGVSAGPGPGCRRAAATARARLSDQAGHTGARSVRGWRRRRGQGSRSRRELAAPAAWLPSSGWVGDHGGWSSWKLPPGVARGERRWAWRWGWACGPSAAQAGSGRSRLAANSAMTCDDGWWACQDLNLGPHPYQQSTGNRCATRRSRRSRSTVGAEVTQ